MRLLSWQKTAMRVGWLAAVPGVLLAASFFVPYFGHPEAASFRRFYADPATCFLRDACAARAPARRLRKQ